MKRITKFRIAMTIATLIFVSGIIISLWAAHISDLADTKFEEYYDAEIDSYYEEKYYNQYLDLLDKCNNYLMISGCFLYVGVAMLVGLTILIWNVKEIN